MLTAITWWIISHSDYTGAPESWVGRLFQAVLYLAIVAALSVDIRVAWWFWIT
jgi:hypothetical protein